MQNFETKKMFNQILDFQKNTFDNAFDTVVKIQQQTEKMTDVLFKEQAKFPEEGKQFINECKSSYKKYQSEFKSSVDDGFDKMKGYFDEQKSKTKTSSTSKSK